MTRGAGIKRSETIESGYPCIRYGELYTTYKTSFTVAQSYTSFEVYSKAYKVHKNDILMSLTGENKEDISKGLAYLGNEEIAMGGDMACLSNHNMNPLFIVYTLNSPYGINIKRKLATGDIIVHLSNNRLACIRIPIPPYNEQIRITNCINQIFKLID